MAALSPPLSQNDERVLNALFDAESSLSSGITLSNDPPALSPTDLAIKERESAAIRPLNSPSPSRAHIDACISELNDIIDHHPSHASAYTNRAQATRLLCTVDAQEGTDAVRFFSPANAPRARDMLADLTRAITLATPAPSAAVSPADARLLSAAHTHRGYILLQAAKAVATDPAHASAQLPDALQALDADALEEMASKDFFWGGRYGNDVARALAVKTNPYAKMCGAIVKEALQEEMKQYQPTL